VVINTEKAGTKSRSEKNLLNRLRATKLQPKATKIKMFTDASSKKSILSAKSETEPILTAKKNSTKK